MNIECNFAGSAEVLHVHCDQDGNQMNCREIMALQ